MNTISHPVTRRVVVALAIASAGFTLGSAFAAEKTATPQYENYIDFGAGGTLLSGDRDNFQKLYHQRKDGAAGVSAFHYTTDLDKTTSLTADGRFLYGNADYRFRLKLSREKVGYIAAGYTKYRTWFDGSGGYFPPSGILFQLYNEDLHLDRSDLWLEAALLPENRPSMRFRYDYTTREGMKDTTHWADTSLTGGLGTRNVLPTFLQIKEHRHIVNAAIAQDAEQTSWQVAGRYERSKQENTRQIHRAPGERTERYVTHQEDSENDLFMLRGSVETRLGETLSLSTGMAHYDIDTAIGGSRIAGDSTYNPKFSPTYSHRQFHDEGFYDLEGSTHMNQTIANLNLMFMPNEKWSFVPSLKAEKTRWGAKAEYVETNVGSGPAFTMAQEEMESESDKEYRGLTEAFDVRYTGIKNVALTGNIEWEQTYGTLNEDLLERELGVDVIYRTTNFRRDAQRYVATAHWYVKSGLSFTGQYYWKGRQNSFSNTRQSTNPGPSSGDRYPAYITHQDFETNDFNLRMSWSPALSVHTVSRYDYQESTIRTQTIGLAFVQSAEVKSHILSETISWNPHPRWFVQTSGNLIFDRTVTPAHQIGGTAGQSVLNSDNNYVSGSVMTGYALDQKTDVTAEYSYYRSNNYVDNSAFSVPYGAAATNQLFGLTWFRRVSPQLNYLVKYVYGDNDDVTSGGRNSFRAHMVFAKVQYRF